MVSFRLAVADLAPCLRVVRGVSRLVLLLLQRVDEERWIELFAEEGHVSITARHNRCTEDSMMLTSSWNRAHLLRRRRRPHVSHPRLRWSLWGRAAIRRRGRVLRGHACFKACPAPVPLILTFRRAIARLLVIARARALLRFLLGGLRELVTSRVCVSSSPLRECAGLRCPFLLLYCGSTKQ